MTPVQIRDAIYNIFNSSWSHTSIAWPNKVFNPENATNGYWLRFDLRFGDSFVGELNEDGIGERIGILYVDLFCDQNKGTKQIYTYAGYVEDLFAKKDISNVFFGEASTNDLGIDVVGKYHLQVKIPFWTFIRE